MLWNCDRLMNPKLPKGLIFFYLITQLPAGRNAGLSLSGFNRTRSTCNVISRWNFSFVSALELWLISKIKNCNTYNFLQKQTRLENCLVNVSPQGLTVCWKSSGEFFPLFFLASRYGLAKNLKASAVCEIAHRGRADFLSNFCDVFWSSDFLPL